MNLFRGANRAPVRLGKELGRGGEGAVFPVIASPGVVAKVYFKPPSPAKADKLRAMARHAAPALLRAAAWPLDVLSDDSGTVRGFIMSRIDAREDLHELYSPKSRRRAFPNADFRFVVRVATNLARAFAQVHAQGNVIGDVNHGNALVGRDGTVVLIDCDSFQVRHAGRTFTCDVGVPLFTPPELAGRAFRGLTRTANHDSFGLAVLLFHLLFMGRHPFAGRYVDGEMPIERAIAESRFVYGGNAAAHGMSPPPGTLPLDTFGSRIATLFEAAFAAPGEAARPTPVHWVDALQALESELETCAVSQAHSHPRGPGPDAGCCWCAHEKRTGVRVFGRQLVEVAAVGTAHIAKLWDSIVAIPRPQAPQPAEPPSPGARHFMASDALGSRARAFLGITLALFGCVALGMKPGGTALTSLFYFGSAVACFWSLMKRTVTGQGSAEAAVLIAREQVTSLVNRWNAMSDDGRFDTLLTKLEGVKRQLLELPTVRASRIRMLAQQVAQTQHDRFLSLFRIEKSGVPLLTRSDIAMLASHGIDSADDVLRRAGDLPGLINHMKASQLEIWARRQSGKFNFDAARDLEPDQLREVDQLERAQQQQYVDILQQGEQELRQLSQEIERDREAARRDLDKARARLAKAEKELS
jgi:DNA-binding helix-hairpin-helix protein with protein kinase domain